MQLALPNYVHKLTASWADMDFNAHMANTAYLNRAVDARMAFFTENGLSLPELMRLRISWVVMKDEVEYRREIQWMEEISITVALAGLAPDGSRFKVRNDFLRADGQLAARVTSTGGFLAIQFQGEGGAVAIPNPSFKRSTNGGPPGPGLAFCRRRPLRSNVALA